MSFAKLPILLLFVLFLSGCGDGGVVSGSCPPAEEPPSLDRTCSADGECDGYLVCSDNQCTWPAAMTGEVGDDTSRVRVEHDGALVGAVSVELARGDLARRRGLAGRPCLQSGWGMLFVHPDEEKLAYTVEEMRFAIDLVFADADGVIVAVRAELEPGSTGVVRSGVAAKYALEVAGGTVDELGVGVGDRLVFGE